MKHEDLEQAVAAAINAGTYDRQFTAKPALLPNWQREQLSQLVVGVSALTRESVFEDREADMFVGDVFIAIGQAVPKGTDEFVRPLIRLVDAIDDQLREVAGVLDLPGDQAVAWQESLIDPYYDPDILREWLLFAAAITVRYESID